MRLHDSLAPIAAALSLGGAASAQSFNIDVGDTFSVGIPAPTYGAAASQPGPWNALSGGYPYNFSLDDVNGTPTGVTTFAVNTGVGSGDFYFDNVLTSGDDEKLLDDLEDVGSGTSITVWTFSGLADGPYDVYTYAWAPDNAGYVSNVTPGGSSDTQSVGGTFPGGHALGTTYALHCVTVAGGSDLVIEVAAGTGFASVNGFQIVERSQPCPPDVPGVGFCFCDGQGSPAPCGNTGATGNGCANGSDPNGAHLAASGVADTNNDSVVLHGTGLAPGQPGLYFQGDNAVNGGLGNPFGDGLRCVGTNVVRLQVVTADAGGASSTTVQISVAGGVAPGDVKHYQLWYRDPAGSQCGFGFNLTNGYTISWF